MKGAHLPMDDCYTSYGRSAGHMTGRNSRIDGPVVPLPDPGEGNPVYPYPDVDLPVAPLPGPGEGGPVYPYPGIDLPVAPLPGPGEGGPVYPGTGGGEPVIPLPNPGEGGPVYPGSGVIILPGIIHPRYCTVRFLNAVADYDPLRIIVAPRQISNRVNFGGLTNYFHVIDGFRLVTITSAYAPYRILYQQTIPFRAGEIATMAVVRGNSGLDLVRISDMPCNNIPRSRACIRTINLAYPAPPLDVFLTDGRLVFNDVAYKESTNFKQAMPRDYSFFVAKTQFIPLPNFQDIETIEQTPMVAPDLTLQGSDTVTPLVTFFVDARPGAMYSIYILGTWYNSPNLRVRVVEDFFA